jgi:hypothetical protein
MLNQSFCGIAACLAVLVSCVSSASAGAVIPTFTTFGSLPSATFGGSGIPNNAVAITTIADGNATITLGLTAHPRFGSPAVTNDGAGTFTASVGGYPGAPNLAKWNFGFYIGVANGNLADYVFELLYDFDPASGNDEATHGKIGAFSIVNNPEQGSQNLGFAFLATAVPGFIDPPTFASFNPNAAGEYSFSLRAFYLRGGLLGESAIRVNAVPEPGTFAIFAIGAIGVAGTMVRRRRGMALATVCSNA